MNNNRLIADKAFPAFSVSKLGGGEIEIGGKRDQWTLLLIYRGRHCARCKKYFAKLQAMKAAWESAGFHIIAISADTQEKAMADVDEFNWTFDIGYGLTEVQMKLLGVFVSEPLSASETDRRFAEPGVFCITPDGRAHVIAVSNAPSARPDLDELLDGMIFNIKNDRATRGTA